MLTRIPLLKIIYIKLTAKCYEQLRLVSKADL